MVSIFLTQVSHIPQILFVLFNLQLQFYFYNSKVKDVFRFVINHISMMMIPNHISLRNNNLRNIILKSMIMLGQTEDQTIKWKKI